MVSGQPEPLSLCGISAMVLEVCGDVLAHRAIAARRALNEHAVLVAQRGREPVDLRLGGEDECQVLVALEEPPAALDEIDHVLIGIGLGEAEHRHRVAHLGKALDRRRPPTFSLRLSARFSSGNAASIAW